MWLLYASQVIALALCTLDTSKAFLVSPAALRHRASRLSSSTTPARETTEQETTQSTGKWNPRTMPKKRKELLELPDDARNWNVEGSRTEVWEDQPNPMSDLDWVKAFAPSEEEEEAASLGFDWSDPDKWFDAHGGRLEEDKDDGSS